MLLQFFVYWERRVADDLYQSAVTSLQGGGV